MQTIIVIDNIVLKNGTLYAVGREEKETMVFLKRGNLAGKCAVYSLMMMLIFHKRINREDLFSKINFEAPPYINELKKKLLLRTKREYSMLSLRDKLLLSFNNHIHVDVFSISNIIEDEHRKLHFMIKEHLDAGWPVQIGFSFPRFCLDSAFDLEYTSIWNNIIDINMDYDGLLKLDYNHNVGVEVHVNSILLINDKLDLPFEPEEKDSFLPF